jgi:hypothetical protein
VVAVYRQYFGIDINDPDGCLVRGVDYVVGVVRMAKKLEQENVRIIFMSILDDCDLYGREGKEAEHMLNYIAGVKDMANAVMDAIVE